MTAANNVANLPVAVPSRLPMPQGAAARGISPAQWRVLVDTTFPNARDPEAVMMAYDYCKVRGLDVWKKPVHIVPMWNGALQREVETIWPGINEIQITASRTGAWAGMDSPRWGPTKRRTFTGTRKTKQGWQHVSVEVEFPEWCEVTVYRIVAGQPRAFSEPVYWLEAYSTTGGRDSELPTDMWVKRPRGQVHKVAKAAALRAAFPEEGEYTAEEMEGKAIEAAVLVEPPPPPPPKVEKPPIEINLPGGWEPAKFPRTKPGLREALKFLTDAVLDREPQVVAMNNDLLDQIAERMPELADEVAGLRAAAAEALAPPDEPPEPDEPGPLNPDEVDEFGLRAVSGGDHG